MWSPAEWIALLAIIVGVLTTAVAALTTFLWKLSIEVANLKRDLAWMQRGMSTWKHVFRSLMKGDSDDKEISDEDAGGW